MKNQYQNQNRKAVLHVRVYNAHGNSLEVAYDAKGNVLNANQIIKFEHDTLAWVNFLKNVTFLGYIKIKIAKITRQNEKGVYVESKETKKDFQYEIDVKFLGSEKAKKILAKKNKKAKEGGQAGEVIEDELQKARDEYKKLYGKKGHHMWKLETLKTKIAEHESNKKILVPTD